MELEERTLKTSTFKMDKGLRVTCTVTQKDFRKNKRVGVHPRGRRFECFRRNKQVRDVKRLPWMGENGE